jgi:hypothetical protein
MIDGGGPGKYSRIYSDLNNKNVKDCKAKFDALSLTEREVGQLFCVFQDLNLDRSGVVTSYHVMTYLRCDTVNKFIKRMLYPLRRGLRFDGFVIAIWDLCTVKQEELGTSLQFIDASLTSSAAVI